MPDHYDAICEINQSLVNEVKTLSQEMENLKTLCQEIETLKTLLFKMELMQNQIAKLEKGNDISRRLLFPNTETVKQPVAFSAFLSHPFNASTFGTFREIVYDQIETNNGQVYDKYSGTFRAPVAGTYAFTWTIFVEGEADANGRNGEIPVELVVNGVVHGVIHADTEVHHDDDSSTGFVIVGLSVGDTVFTRSGNFPAQGQILSNDYARWTFSGWLIS